jgi:hypothetical protein
MELNSSLALHLTSHAILLEQHEHRNSGGRPFWALASDAPRGRLMRAARGLAARLFVAAQSAFARCPESAEAQPA